MPLEPRNTRGCLCHSACSQTAARTSAFASRSRRRYGLTLIELLVSVTLTLMLVFAIVQVFDMLGQTMTKGRATIEMAGNMRTVANRLQEDLDNLTCPVRPWIDPAAGQGYFEYVEGANLAMWPTNQIFRGHDQDGFNFADQRPGPDGVPDYLLDQNGDGQPDDVNGDGQPDHTQFGDLDDILMMTVRAQGEPFRGRFDNNNDPSDGYIIVESEYAEVIWWTTIDPISQTVRLHRRALLIGPKLPTGATVDLSGYPLDLSTTNGPLQIKRFFQLNDVSARVDTSGGTPSFQLNTLSDLTAPRNRFAHFRLNENFGVNFTPSMTMQPDTNPGWVYPVDARFLWPRNPSKLSQQWNLLSGGNSGALVLDDFLVDRTGDDVVLTDVLGFDVRAFDPTAPIGIVGDVAVSYGDPGFASSTFVGRGAFVDLGASGQIHSTVNNKLADGPNEITDGGNPPIWVSYDTWSLGFERDGIDQDFQQDTPPPQTDEGFDGIDNPYQGFATGGVDDYEERETRPPYNVPLSGIEVRIRMMEYSTRQIRQVSVVGDFTD